MLLSKFCDYEIQSEIQKSIARSKLLSNRGKILRRGGNVKRDLSRKSSSFMITKPRILIMHTKYCTALSCRWCQIALVNSRNYRLVPNFTNVSVLQLGFKRRIEENKSSKKAGFSRLPIALGIYYQLLETSLADFFA